MPKGRPRGESDLGRPSIRTRALSNGYGLPGFSVTGDVTLSALTETPAPSSPSSPSSSSIQDVPYELLTAILLPLPYLLSSLLRPHEIHSNHVHYSTNLEAAEEILEEVASTALPVPTSSPSLIQACALTAGTLLLVGFLGRMQSSAAPLDRRKSQLGTNNYTSKTASSLLSWDTIRRMLLRMVNIGLPFLATVEIGGVRTGMILLTAAAGGLLSPDAKLADPLTVKTWRRALTTRRWTCAVFFVTLLCDLFWLRRDAEPTSLIRGYVALAKSVLFLQIPLPTTSPTTSRLTASRLSTSTSSTPTLPATVWGKQHNTIRSPQQKHCSPLVYTKRDTNLTIAAGLILGILTLVLSSILAVSLQFHYSTIAISAASISSAAVLLCFSQPPSIRLRPYLGYSLGLCICAAFGIWFDSGNSKSALALLLVSGLSYAALYLDTRLQTDQKKPHVHDHSTRHNHHQKLRGSALTQFLLRKSEDWPLLHGVLLDKESRRIVYFMTLNLIFMFVQTFYAVVSGSLGLLSDSIHMFFDCVGLLAGLVAAVMSKWPPNSKFPYGYGKVETLSGLGNGIFLMIISVEIIWESLERFLEGAELRRLNELLVVSVGGLLVNLLGLKFIGHAHHGHGHDHGSHGHHQDHSHANGNSHSPQREEDSNSHSHNHVHDNRPLSPTSKIAIPTHSHSNENMAGIYLHILADTMGSVAVIISALLITYTGWSGWDPLASCVIAILIIAASIPLVVGSAKRLLLTVPSEVEYALRSTLQELSALRGVAGYAVPRFWLDDSDSGGEDGHGQGHHHRHDEKEDCAGDLIHEHNHDHDHDHDHGRETQQKILGVIHIIAAPTADLDDVRARVDGFLRERNMDVIVHVEREGHGQGACWCGGAGVGAGAGMDVRRSSVIAL